MMRVIVAGSIVVMLSLVILTIVAMFAGASGAGSGGGVGLFRAFGIPSNASGNG